MQFLTPKAVCAKIAVSRTTLDRMVAARVFPQPIKLSARRIAFNAAAVDRWMAERIGEAA